MQTITSTILIAEGLHPHKLKQKEKQGNGCPMPLGRMLRRRLDMLTNLSLSYLSTAPLWSAEAVSISRGGSPTTPRTFMAAGAFCFKGQRIRGLRKHFPGAWMGLEQEWIFRVTDHSVQHSAPDREWQRSNVFVNKCICWCVCENWGPGQGLLLPWYEGGCGSGQP